MMMEQKKYPYKVSVSIITYNQAEYISKAIDSALAQEVNFPYEIIIGDDCSTDGTRDILRDYRQKYPELIKLHLHEEKGDGIPGRKNNIANIRSARGKYVAFLDGDDWWISTDKLQRQADFLDAHSEYAFCAHNAWEVKEGAYQKPVSSKFSELQHNQRFTFSEIAAKRFHLPSVSLFIRSTHLQELPEWFWNVYTADYALQLIAAQHGPARYFRDVYGAYRIHDTNISREYFFGKNHLEVLNSDDKIYRQHLPESHKYTLDYRSEYYLVQSTSHFNDRRFDKAFISLLKSFYYDWRAVNRAAAKIHVRLRQQFVTEAPPVSE